MIQGFELSYEGVGKQANKGLRYLNPFLSTSRRLFGELTSDQAALERLIVDTSKLSGALAARAPDISALVGNLNRMMNAIGDRKERLADGDRASSPTSCARRTPPSSTCAPRSTTSTRWSTPRSRSRVELRPFLAELRAAAADAVPTVRDLDAIVKRRGQANDLVELTLIQPKLAARRGRLRLARLRPGHREPRRPRDRRRRRLHPGRLRRGGLLARQRRDQPRLLPRLHARAGRLVRRLRPLGRTSTRYGGLGRIETTFNAFSVSDPGGIPDLTRAADPRPSSLASLDTGNNRRCPGGNERPVTDIDPSDTSVPFTDGGALTDGEPGDCDPEPRAARPMRRIALILAAARGRRSPASPRPPAPTTRTPTRSRCTTRSASSPGSDVRIAGVNAGHGHRPRHQRRQARPGHGRAHRRARHARRGHELLVRAAVADRRVLHLLRAGRARRSTEDDDTDDPDADIPAEPGRADGPERPRPEHAARAVQASACSC